MKLLGMKFHRNMWTGGQTWQS